MTLKEAFNQWSVAPRNSVLANRSRDAVNNVLLKEYGDTDLELIDETFAREIFLGSDVAQELKTKAASILVYVLQWGGDNGHCRRPSFDYSIARKPEVKPADKPKGRKKPQEVIKPQKNTEDTEEMKPSDTVGTVPAVGSDAKECTTEGLSPAVVAPTDEGGKKEADQTTPTPPRSAMPLATSKNSGGNAAAQDICDSQKDQCESVSSVAKEESVAKPKRIIRKVDDDICQLDPKTLAVIKKWPHAHRIMQELGIGNVVRAIGRCGIAGGFYWSYSKDLDTFRERLAARQEHNALVHADHCAQMRAAKEPQNTQKDTEKKKKTSKKTAVASPPELGGDRGGLNNGSASPQVTEEKINTEASKKTAAVCDNKKSPCESVSSVATPSLRGRAGKGLSGFTDDELFAELDRRGWYCILSRTEIVTIGNK